MSFFKCFTQKANGIVSVKLLVVNIFLKCINIYQHQLLTQTFNKYIREGALVIPVTILITNQDF